MLFLPRKLKPCRYCIRTERLASISQNNSSFGSANTERIRSATLVAQLYSMRSFIVFVWVLILSLKAIAQQDTTTYKTFEAALLRQDFDSLYKALQLNHPDLYKHFSKAAADKAFRQALGQIDQSMSRRDFMRILALFVALFRDGHTYMDADFESEDFRQYTNGGGRFFPMSVHIMDGKLYAGAAEPNSGIQKGDELLQLNGMDAKKIVRYLKSFWSADDERNAIATAQRLFSYGLWAVYGWGNETKLAYRRDGKTKTALLKGIDKDAFLKITFGIGSKTRQLHLYPEYSLAVVEINSYGNVERTNRFIDSCFSIIKMQGIRNVALDLRKNGGGNSSIGDYFLAHLTRKPYNTIQSKKWNLASPLIGQLASEHWLSKALEADRQTYTVQGKFLQSPNWGPQPASGLKDSALFVPAEFFLLTGPRTYSSAHMTALAVKCGGLGTIIGQPTGERLDLTGEILEYKLPNTGLVVVIPVAAYQTACGDGNTVGVSPDHLVRTTIEDIRSGRDPELIFLIEMIATKKKQ